MPAVRRVRALDAESKWRPFCSERCKTIDLGAWAAERYRIPAAEAPDEDSIRTTRRGPRRRRRRRSASKRVRAHGGMDAGHAARRNAMPCAPCVDRPRRGRRRQGRPAHRPARASARCGREASQPSGVARDASASQRPAPARRSRDRAIAARSSSARVWHDAATIRSRGRELAAASLAAVQWTPAQPSSPRLVGGAVEQHRAPCAAPARRAAPRSRPARERPLLFAQLDQPQAASRARGSARARNASSPRSAAQVIP